MTACDQHSRTVRILLSCEDLDQKSRFGGGRGEMEESGGRSFGGGRCNTFSRPRWNPKPNTAHTTKSDGAPPKHYRSPTLERLQSDNHQRKDFNWPIRALSPAIVRSPLDCVMGIKTSVCGVKISRKLQHPALVPYGCFAILSSAVDDILQDARVRRCVPVLRQHH